MPEFGEDRLMQKNETLVSVLLPVYNAERYLPRCLDSILAQTHKAIEIVAIDDGSKDRSGAILDAYSISNPGTFIVEHRENGGVASARNRAIELARGEYLTFIDNDDYFDQDYISSLLNIALENKADVVCGGYKRPDSEGRIVSSAMPTPDTTWGPYVVEAAWAKLYRTEYVRKAHLSFLPVNIGEDLYFTLPAVVSTDKVVVLPYCGYNWFMNDESVSNTSQRSSRGLEFGQVLDGLYGRIRELEKEPTATLEFYFVRYVAWFLLYTCRGDNVKECADNYRRYTKWLDGHFRGWRKNELSAPSRPTGETPFNRIAVWLFAKHPTLFRACLKSYRALGASK